MNPTNEQIAEVAKKEIKRRCPGLPSILTDWLWFRIELGITEATAPLQREIEELKSRLGPIDPGGGDKLDELESSNAQLQHRLEQAEKACADLKHVLEVIEDGGRPHTGRSVAYPDGCECPQCEAYDQAIKMLQHPCGKDYIYKDEPTPEQTKAYLKWHNDPHAMSRYDAKDGERATMLWSEYEALKNDSARLDKLERIFNGTEQYFFNLTDGKPIRQAIDELKEDE